MSSVARDVLEDDTGSDGSPWYITEFGSGQTESDVDASRRLKRSLVNRYAKRSVLRQVDPKSRMARCGRHIIPSKCFVSVRCDGRQASVNNLQMCGLLWLCPVCACKVTEERRKELKAALVASKRYDFSTCLLTLTMPHHAGDSARELVDVLFGSWGKLTKARTGAALRALGWRHYIRGFEITWGRRNGWHPHLHVLVFCAPGTDLEALRGFIESMWLAALASYGYVGNDHAVDMRLTDGDVWHYVAKYGQDKGGGDWGVSGELTKGHIKQGRNGRYTPFDILGAGMSGELPMWQVRKIYGEYAAAVKGRKQLVWSKGLKDLLIPELDELTDEEIAERAGNELPEVARLTFGQWRVIFNKGAVADFISQVIDDSSPAAIAGFLAWLGCESTSTWVV